ncbi:hypothetical protein Pelo_5137 [Pelomyxa schiedti]|nr:hypothetical protein Pelo_5137 [Pelomyxa schiedti]
MVSSVVKGAFVYLDRLAVDAQKSANEANVEVDDTLSKIRAEMLAMVDAKIGKLKAEIQSNLETSFNKLKSLNSNDYTGKQRLLCSRERLMKVLRTSLEEISIFKGTHILDLPVAVLSRIICYLPRKSILAARATCLQLWDAVACGCRDSPISTEAHKGSHPILGEAWMFTGKDTFSTPCMTFQVSVVKIPTGGIGVYFRVIKRKLYAQAKKVIVQLHPCAFNNQQQQQQQQQPQQPLKPQACFLETYQLAKSAKWGVEFPDEVTRVQISITMLEGTSVVPKGPSPTFRHRPRLNA